MWKKVGLFKAPPMVRCTCHSLMLRHAFVVPPASVTLAKDVSTPENERGGGPAVQVECGIDRGRRQAA